MANNYTSIKVVADRLLRHPMMAGISFESIIDYTIDFMRIVQCGGFFTEKCDIVDINEYRGLLPDDFYEVNQIRLKTLHTRTPIMEEDTIETTDGSIVGIGTFHQKLDENGYPIYLDEPTHSNLSFRHTTDSFHMSENSVHIDLTYKIQGGYIYTSIKEGAIELSYKAILLDEECYPMIPDNSKFLRALESYIKKQWFTILFDMGKLQAPILQNVQQEYAWAVGACESEFQKMSLDKAESFYNSWRTLIPRTNEHYMGYATTGRRQNLKID